MTLLELSIEYFSLVYFAAIGVMQAAAGRSGRNNFFFFTRKLHGYLFAFAMVNLSMFGFFTWNGRNPTGVIEGSQQFLLFILGVACAIGASYVIAQFSKVRVMILKDRRKNPGKRISRELSRPDNFRNDGTV